MMMLVGNSLGCNARSVSKNVDDYRPTASLDGLVQDRDFEPERVFKRPLAPGFDAYHTFIVGPVIIDYRNPNMADLPQETIAEIEDKLIAAITDELRDGGYRVGTRVRPGTMRMAFVVSGFTAPEGGGALNATAMVAGAAAGVPMLITLSVGEVTVEGVFSDAYEKRIDAVVIDRSADARIFNGNPLSTWADVEAAFRKWAEGIRATVDPDHGR